jgi:DNA-binding MarR family transcriptional regulator
VGEILKQRIKQKKFEGASHEAMLNLIVAAGYVRQQVDEACAPYEITQAQYNALRILRGAYPDGYPRGEVGSRMLDRAPDVTRLIDRLERRGLVERIRSRADRRLSMTRITRAGLELLKRMEPRIQQVQRAFGQRMSARELRQLSALCEKLYGTEEA